MEIRNEELHTGSLILEELKPSSWQPTLYTVVEVLVDWLDLKFEDVLPEERAAIARQVLSELDESIESSVKQRIADRAKDFNELEPEEQKERRALRIPSPQPWFGTKRRSIQASCPSCSSLGLVTGEIAARSEARIGDGEIERELIVLPSEFQCGACELQLSGLAELHHAGLSDEFSVTDSEDPIDYFGIDPKDYVSIEDLVEPDYGND